MHKRKKLIVAILAAVGMLVATSRAPAQTLTVTLSTAAMSFNLVRASATNLGTPSVNVTTRWVIGGQHLDLTVYSFFANSTSAMSGNGINIPSSAFSISTNGTAFRDLIISEPFGGANAGRRIIADIAITGTNQRTDNVVLNLDLTGIPQLPAGTYTGTLSIRAQAI